MGNLLSAAAPVRQQVAVFNPETSIGWHSLLWAEGTAMTAQGYSDTDPVGTWPNETGESDATGVNSGVFNTSNAVFNNRSSVNFFAPDNLTMTFGTGLDYTNGASFVMIGRATSAGNSTHNYCTGFQRGGQWRLNAGILITGGGRDANANIFNWFYPGAAGDSSLWVNDSLVLTGDAGSNEVGATSFYVAGSTYDNEFCLMGIYEGDITADSNWSAFMSWASDYYGVAI